MERLYGLDALRGIAALFVAVHHLLRIEGWDSPIAPALAVDLFFILSGFVMARTYEPRMRDGLSAVRFIALRYRRLFLPLAIGSTLGMIWALGAGGPPLELGLAYVLILGFVPAFWMASSFLTNIPAWSLFLEISANALHGAVLGKMSSAAMIKLYVVTAAVFCATFFAGQSQWGPGIGSILWLIPRELSCYLMGILIFRIYGDRPLGNRPLAPIALLPVLLLANHFSPLLELVSVLVAAPFIVRASLSLPRAVGPLWLGALSYPLYATHAPVMRLADRAGVIPIAALTIAILVAFAVTVVFEKSAKARPGKTAAALMSAS